MDPFVLSESSSSFLLLLFFLSLYLLPLVMSSDAEALMSLKSSMDPLNLLPWQGTDACSWEGVRECLNGRVTKLVVENFNLSGTLQDSGLNRLDQLRVLSLKTNSLSGQIPQLSGLTNLKTLYLNNNRFSGGIPSSISGLHRLKVVVFAGNRISGGIPDSLLNLHRLHTLYLQDNIFTGNVPPFNQSSLRLFNVSNNQLSGEIPPTPALVRFNKSSFSGNFDLCGEQVQNPCREVSNFGPSRSPAYGVQIPKWSSNSKKIIKIIAGSVVGGFALLFICTFLLFLTCKNGGKTESSQAAAECRGTECNNFEKKVQFSWEDEEGVGSLVFLGAADCSQRSYSMEDLLRATAETLGRGSVGSTYKAVMESGFIVTVKRLKTPTYPRVEEFRRHVALMGRLSHPNLVPLRAYVQAKDERLLVYDYFPNGSLFSLVHGTIPSDSGKPLHWTSCLKVAQDVAAGLLHIHQNPGLTHGNLKSTNILLGPDFESCLTDYGLTPFLDPKSVEQPSVSSLFHRAPECRNPRRPSTQPGDVYSFGVLLLELLTGRAPYEDLVAENHQRDIPTWVRSVREGEMATSNEATSGNEMSQEKLQLLIDIAMACVTYVPEKRPHMREVFMMIRDARVEVQYSSSNVSDHSLGRWSDTVQSRPRDHEHLSISYV